MPRDFEGRAPRASQVCRLAKLVSMVIVAASIESFSMMATLSS